LKIRIREKGNIDVIRWCKWSNIERN